MVVIRPVSVRSRANDRGQILQPRGVFVRLQVRLSRGLVRVCPGAIYWGGRYGGHRREKVGRWLLFAQWASSGLCGRVPMILGHHS